MSDTSIQLVPKHIAVIMDGNGRWAKSRGKLRPDGHRAGVERVRGLVEGCLNTGVEVLTLFAFSSENWRRPKLEVATIMQLFMQGLKKETPELHRQGVQLKFIGDWGPLSTSLKKVFSATEALTAGNSRLKLRIAVNYGGRWEIVEAAKRLAADVAEGKQNLAQVDEGVFSKYLAFSDVPDPDLMIRTSGEQRISNFLLWESAYTEFYFPPVLFPDFDRAEFDKALLWYQQRQRRFGGV